MTPAELDRLELLHPEARWRIERLMEAMKAKGFDVFVGATARSLAEVEASRLAGRSSAGQTRSWHELGRAADLRPRKKDGSPNYDTGAASFPFWRTLQDEAEKVGMRCLAFLPNGDRRLLKTVKGPRWDPGHVEYRAPYASLTQALKAAAARVA